MTILEWLHKRAMGRRYKSRANVNQWIYLKGVFVFTVLFHFFWRFEVFHTQKKLEKTNDVAQKGFLESR